MHRRRAPVSVPRRGERGGRRSRAVLIIQPRTIANDASSPKRSRREGGGEAGGRCVTSTPCPDVLQPRAPPQGSGTDGPSGCRSPAAPRLARGRAPGEGPPRWGRGWDVRSARINRGPRVGARRHRRRTPQSAAITARGRRRCQRALLLPGGGGSGAGVLQALRAARPCPACPGLSPWGRARSWAPGTKAPPGPAARTWSEPAPAWPHPPFASGHAPRPWPRPLAPLAPFCPVLLLPRPALTPANGNRARTRHRQSARGKNGRGARSPSPWRCGTRPCNTERGGGPRPPRGGAWTPGGSWGAHWGREPWGSKTEGTWGLGGYQKAWGGGRITGCTPAVPLPPRRVALTGHVVPVDPADGPPRGIRLRGEVLLPVVSPCCGDTVVAVAEEPQEVMTTPTEDSPEGVDTEEDDHEVPLTQTEESVPTTKELPEVPAEQLRRSVPRGTCLIHNWQEEVNPRPKTSPGTTVSPCSSQPELLGCP